MDIDIELLLTGKKETPMEYVKHKQNRDAKVGDIIVVVRESNDESSGNTTKGERYKVTHTSYGWGGQAVTIRGDNGQDKTINGLWWDFPIE